MILPPLVTAVGESHFEQRLMRKLLCSAALQLICTEDERWSSKPTPRVIMEKN
jgi:hypothetical protein